MSESKGPDPIELNEDEIRRLCHDEGLSKKEVGEKLGVSEMTIVRRMRKYDIETKERSKAIAQNHASYYPTSNGYMVAADHMNGDHKWARIHRLLAVAECGFEEVCEKEVHHINGVKWDNRPDNIELLTAEEHRRLHAKERYSGKGPVA